MLYKHAIKLCSVILSTLRIEHEFFYPAIYDAKDFSHVNLPIAILVPCSYKTGTNNKHGVYDESFPTSMSSQMCRFLLFVYFDYTLGEFIYITLLPPFTIPFDIAFGIKNLSLCLTLIVLVSVHSMHLDYACLVTFTAIPLAADFKTMHYKTYQTFQTWEVR